MAVSSTFKKLPGSRQAEILDAAARVFAEKGYSEASVADICQAAGISNGALYKYFTNKQDLFEAVIRRMTSLLLASAQKFSGFHRSIHTTLREILKEAVTFLKAHRDYFIIYMDLGSPSMGSFARVLSDDVEKGSVDFFRALVERAKERGEIGREIDTASAAYMLDNHLMLFGFSCVSEHYDRRMRQYLADGNNLLSTEQKIDRLMRSYEQLLGLEGSSDHQHGLVAKQEEAHDEKVP